MSDWGYRQLILSGTCPPSTKKYFENSQVGITYGTVSLTSGATESTLQSLDIEKHPEKVKPTVTLTPIGEIANVNTYTYEVTWSSNLAVWQWKAACSHNGFVGTGEAAQTVGRVDINYQVMSTWT